MDESRRITRPLPLIYVGYDMEKARHSIAVLGEDHGHSFLHTVAHIDRLEDAELFIQALNVLYGAILHEEDNHG